MSSPTHVKVFLGSPSDVKEDRDVALRVLKSIEGTAVFKGRLTIEVFTYDDAAAPTAMPANVTPELGIARSGGRPSQHDLTIVLLWSRMGTRLPSSMLRPDGSRYESGTEWELEDARRAGRDAFVYLRAHPPPAETHASAEARDQLARLRKFVDSFRNQDGSLAGFVHEYRSSADLAATLEKHMEGVVRRLLERVERKSAWLRVGAMAALLLVLGGAVLVRQAGVVEAERQRVRQAETRALDAQRPRIDFRSADRCVFAHAGEEHQGSLELDYDVANAAPAAAVFLALAPDRDFGDTPMVRRDLQRDQHAHKMTVEFRIPPTAMPDWTGWARIEVAAEAVTSRAIEVTCRGSAR